MYLCPWMEDDSLDPCPPAHAPAYNKMFEYMRDAVLSYRSSPESAVRRLVEGSDIAKAVGAPRWRLYFDHWRCDLMMRSGREYRQANLIAKRITLETRNTDIGDDPIRTLLEIDIARSLVGMDAVENRAAVEKSLANLDTVAVAEVRNPYLDLAGLFLLEVGDLDGAEAAADEAASRCLATRFWDGLGAARCYQCRIASAKGDWDELMRTPLLDQELWDEGMGTDLAEMQMWYALGGLKSGDADQARTDFDSAASRLRSAYYKPTTGYVDAAVACLEGMEDIDSALAMLEADLKISTAGGAKHRVQHCTEEIARLTARVNA